MKPIIKKILLAVLMLIVIAVSYGLYQWYKPHRNIQNEEAVTVTAAQLYQSFKANEKDPKYLDKAIQVSGMVSETSTNQAGKTVCYLETADPSAIINCTFTDNTPIKPKAQITIKGRCTGYSGDLLPQVTLVDCKPVN